MRRYITKSGKEMLVFSEEEREQVEEKYWQLARVYSAFSGKWNKKDRESYQEILPWIFKRGIDLSYAQVYQVDKMLKKVGLDFMTYFELDIEEEPLTSKEMFEIMKEKREKYGGKDKYDKYRK